MNENYSREEYEKTLQYARERGYWAMYNSMAEDGYSADVDWKLLRREDL